MRIAELRAGLTDIQRILVNFGVTKQASEMQALTDALIEFDDMTLPELVRSLKAASAASKKKQPPVLHEVAIADALGKLQASMHMAESFDDAVEFILKDKRLKQSELLEVARKFGGSSPAKATKPAIASFLKERRLEMKRQGGLSATIDKMLGRSE